MTHRIRPLAWPVRLCLVTFLVLATAFALSVRAETANASDDFRFEGRGWGHGIGMSQYGARALAENGRSYKQIISHYYKDASVGSAPSTHRPWVGLLQDRTSASFRAETSGVTGWDKHGSFTMSRNVTWTYERVDSSRCRWRSSGGTTRSPHDCHASITGSSDARVTVTNKSRQYLLGSSTAMRLRSLPSNKSRFHVSLELPLERYVNGIAEVPAAWHVNALRAQAVAARSYAVFRLLHLGSASNFTTSRKNSCWCHLFDGTSDQVYAGWARESSSRWRSAVRDTRNEVVRHSSSTGTRSGVAQAFYYSSSGGRTENNEEVWGGSAIPYLRSVDDPWSLHSSAQNPNRSWAANVSPSQVASRVGLDTVTRIEVTARNTSGSARTVRFHGRKDGSSTSVSRAGTWVRSAFGLRSTFIRRIFLPPFWDDDGSVHEHDIVRIYHAGITRGCNPPTNDMFCPKDGVTREQMAAFVVRAMGLTDDNHPGFKDVKSGSTFDRDIRRLAKAGITKGCNPPANDRFCPKDIVTREQMAAFMSRALELTDEGSKRFRDVERGSTFERDINRIAAAGITHGCNPPTNDRFCPKHDTSREQMASFLARAFLN